MTTTLTKEQATVEKLLPDIRATHKEFLKSGQATVDLARQIGDMLWKLKECVKKGEWTELVEDRCEFTIRTATTYMKLSGGWELLEKKEAAATTIDGCVKLIGQSKPKTHKGGKRKVVPKPAKSADNGKRGSETESPQPAAAEKPAGPCPHGGDHDYDDEACRRCHDPKPKGRKVTGGTAFNVEELTGESKDAFGTQAPSELRQVFELCEEFDAQRAKLSGIKSWMTQRLAHPGAAVLVDAAQRIKTDLDHLDAELKFAKPYCVCVYCKNESPKVANCNCCKGRGWMTEQLYKAAPKGLKREKAQA